MSLDAKRCAELMAMPSHHPTIAVHLKEQLRDALSLLSECRELAYNLQNEHPALSDLLDKLTEAGI